MTAFWIEAWCHRSRYSETCADRAIAQVSEYRNPWHPGNDGLLTAGFDSIDLHRRKSIMDFGQDHQAIRALYGELIIGWNRRDATRFAAAVTIDANVVGFDGTQMKGRAEVEGMLGLLFSRFKTPTYVVIVREVRFLSADAAVVTSVVGMVPDGQKELNPELNAIQTIVAVKREGVWKVEVLQNTPAAFHYRPETKDALTFELQAALKGRK